MLENYQIDDLGVIHQIEFAPIVYDQQYLSYYHGKSDRTIKLGYQRWGWILGLIQRLPDSVLEIGYGTGSFIEAVKVGGVVRCAGCDIAPFPLPSGVDFIDWTVALDESWDLVAMFDVLEHIPDLNFMSQLKCNYIAVAVPFCRWRELGDQGDQWMKSWRMLLPNEHLHHFDRQSLVAFFNHYNFDCVTLNCFEDGMRLRPREIGPNVLSGFFKKRSA